MTPVPDVARVRALAALAQAPVTPGLDPDVLRAGLIVAAKARGVTWAQIGAALLGTPDGKLAKKRAGQIARAANLKLLRQGQPAMEVPG